MPHLPSTVHPTLEGNLSDSVVILRVCLVAPLHPITIHVHHQEAPVAQEAVPRLSALVLQLPATVRPTLQGTSTITMAMPRLAFGPHLPAAGCGPLATAPQIHQGTLVIPRGTLKLITIVHHPLLAGLNLLAGPNLTASPNLLTASPNLLASPNLPAGPNLPATGPNLLAGVLNPLAGPNLPATGLNLPVASLHLITGLNPLAGSNLPIAGLCLPNATPHPQVVAHRITLAQVTPSLIGHPLVHNKTARGKAQAQLPGQVSSSTTTGSVSSRQTVSTSSKASKSSAGQKTTQKKAAGKSHSKSQKRKKASKTHKHRDGEDETVEVDDEEEDEDVEGNQDGYQGTCGQLKDFKGVERNILSWAGRAFQAIMAAKGMYETDTDTVDDHRIEAWQIGLEKYNKMDKEFPLAMAHVQNMNDHLVTWHTHALGHIQDKAAAQYFPEAVEMTVPKLEAHIKQLKAGGLHTKPGSTPGYGCFQHKLTQTCMNEMLFRFKTDIGVQFAEFFKEPLAELIAFFCMMLQFVVEEWETGKVELDFEDQRKVYNTHLTNHAIWLKIAKDYWVFVQKQLFFHTFKNSGANETALLHKLDEFDQEMADMQPKIREVAREQEGLDPEREGECDNHSDQDPDQWNRDAKMEDRYDKDAIAKNASQIRMRIKTTITVNTKMSMMTTSTTRVTITKKASKLMMIVIIRESSGGMKSVTIIQVGTIVVEIMIIMSLTVSAIITESTRTMRDEGMTPAPTLMIHATTMIIMTTSKTRTSAKPLFMMISTGSFHLHHIF
ncbi:hypothetical protein FRC11_010574, partial [Ceratobasidium sp. 423]